MTITAIRVGDQRFTVEAANDTSVVLELSDGSEVAIDVAAAISAAAAARPDLALGEKVPPRPEAIVSGPIVAPIRRTDAAFTSLVKNTNIKIAFKDEEGTGADRMMTAPLKTALDALATLVAGEWNGTKLRVTEAWDENGEHAAGSLHYEGRAADLTTSPIDNTKLGRLARLAVDAKCDWVFYENAMHVHVSMRKT